jgi:hypothetical protein
MTAIGKERELRPHWQQIRELMLQEADVAAVSWRVQLAVLKDATRGSAPGMTSCVSAEGAARGRMPLFVSARSG